MIRRALELNPTLVQAHRNLILIELGLGRRELATEDLKKAVQLTGNRPEYADLAAHLTPGA